MEKKKWSKKKIALVVVASILCVALVAVALYIQFKPDPAPSVGSASVSRGSLTETVDVSGTVSSAKKGSFVPVDGTKVLTVNVKVGDIVKKGDVLATFDTSGLSTAVAEKQKAYLSAAENYRNAVSTAATASEELKKIEARLAEIDKEIAAAENESQSSGSDQTGGGSSVMNKFWSLVSDALGMQDAMSGLSQLQEMMSGSSSFFGGSSALEMEKMQLELQKVTLELQSGSLTQETYKALMDSGKAELDSINAAVESLKNGWIAEYDGIVSEINISEGQTYTSGTGGQLDLSAIISMANGGIDINALLSSLLSSQQSGITVEYYPFVASFTLNKSDVLKVNLDRPCKVTAADDSIVDGTVSYISPVASQSGGVDISSILGSGSANGVEAQVTIEHPTRSVIIGLDVDISINVDTKENVLLIPTEAVRNGSDGMYVYIYDPDTETISASPVTVGLSDNIHYEVISGCKEGDIVVTSTATGLTLTEGQKVALK